MGISCVPLVVVAMVPIIAGGFGCAVGKRSSTGDDIANIDYPDYSPKYDYPVVPKRAALLFDQLMSALRNTDDLGKFGAIGGKGISKSRVHHFPAANSEIVPVADAQTVATSVLTFKQYYSKRSDYSSHIVRWICNDVGKPRVRFTGAATSTPSRASRGSDNDNTPPSVILNPPKTKREHRFISFPRLNCSSTTRLQQCFPG